jgi:cardiolipin synthase
LPLLEEISGYVFAIGAIVIPAMASVHIISTKHEVRAAIGWTGLVWLVPFVGTVLYLMFGINRIKRKAVRKRLRRMLSRPGRSEVGQLAGPFLPTLFKKATRDMAAQARMLSRLGNFPITGSNRIEHFPTATGAYDVMLAALRSAKNSIALASYIFEAATADGAFVDALSEAAERGVAVRVLLDGVGSLYHRPAATTVLVRRGVRAAQFNRQLVPWRMPYLNLRNHRKILVVDGVRGFAGGMNLRQSYLGKGPDEEQVKDWHFRLEGPVVAHMMEVFAEDWSFATGETLEGEVWFPQDYPKDAADMVARGIPDGPDEDMDKLVWTILGAIGMARHRIAIQTPYFVPDRLLIAALSHAALRGVDVDILLPEKNNLRIVEWGSRAQYTELLRAACRIHHLPPPFDHSKIMIVDDSYVLFGSSNWDARSLRLNFEFNVECFSPDLAAEVGKVFAAKLANARPVALEEMIALPAWKRARNGLAWLTSPYL